MANYFANLPTYQPNTNPINFSPIGNALDSITAQNNANRQFELQQKQSDRADQEQQYRHGRDEKQDKLQAVQLFGKQAGAVEQMQGSQRAAAWQSVLAKHGTDGLTPEELDPVTGPKLMMAQAGQFTDQLDKQEKELGLRKTQAEIDYYNRRDPIDPIDTMIADRMRGLQSPSQAPRPAPPVPYMQQQSFEGAPQQPRLQNINNTIGAPPPSPQPQSGLMPGVQLVGDTLSDGGDQEPHQAVGGDEEIDTPMGPMSRRDAMQLGAQMSLNPKRAAFGKILVDLAKEGSGGPGQLAKPAETDLDKGIISAANTLGRLSDIRKGFKPEFQTLAGKFKMSGASWSSFLGADPDKTFGAGTTQMLKDYSAYRSTAYNNFNMLLKELSGTAVSAQELQRQKLVQPNPGEGIFDGDDPITLQSKLDNGERVARAAMARMNFMRSRGLKFDRNTAEQFLSLDDVPAAIDKRGHEIEQKLKAQNPKIDPMSLERATKKQLSKEFGI
ncbi:hypothetical protein DLM45_02275 [Hyphomicrobium methylovorum]|uniref:hypothetical protein n=1 Tax=Hyphomicrobium methylovorum TaxID=84 RepID=UPI0015E7CBC7|nr:hypothetical protein [Hyphomicrobium methylovorum]MBA2125053.1 hypothetical protein [Hyphomicrobium methylovorum]